MDVYKVKITEPAESDLESIAGYIFFQLNAPTAALNTVRAIRKAIANLKTNALLHPFVRDDRLAAKGYRPLLVKNYIVFYVVAEKDKLVAVDRVIHSRRDWRNIL
jgi:plasmid stabilization system protein ParE